VLQEIRGKMRAMGDLLSRLRHHQKELRKQALAAAAAGDPGVKDGAHWMVGAAEEMGRKSEKCLKELHQILSALVHSADHILKSTPVQPDKDIT